MARLGRGYRPRPTFWQGKPAIPGVSLVIQDAAHAHAADNLVLAARATNDFNGGTNGNSITTSDTGSGDAFDVVSIAGDATVAYSNTHARGSLAAKLQTVSAASCSLAYTSKLGTRTTAYARSYLYLEDAIATNCRVIRVFDGATFKGAVVLLSSGLGQTVRIVDNANTTIATSTTQYPTDAWFRLEARFVANGASGSITCRLFVGANVDGTTADEEISGTADVGTQFTNYQVCLGTTNVGPVWFDDVGWQTDNWLGPTLAPVDLVIADASHVQAADNLAITQTHGLVVADARSTHAADALTLTQLHILTVADALHGHTADLLALTQLHVLTVADARSTHAADGLTLQVTTNLAVDDARSTHAADALLLTQLHLLAVADARSLHAADNLILSQVHLLTVADALHAQAADNVVLNVAGALAIADALHGHAADSVALTQLHLLSVQDAAHAHAADPLVLQVAAVNLIIADAGHLHGAEFLAVAQTHVLGIQEASHGHQSEELTFTQLHLLVIQDALHGHAADNVALTFGIPLIWTREGPQAGGAAVGDVLTVTREGDKAGGAAAGGVLVISREGS